MTEPARADIRYTAFLSYSHKDAAAAARLHRRLESYRVPKRLVGSESPRGPVPRRLWPIFRDREELPAATDLSETVRTALAQSGALIILCSPSAAESLWVAEEIDTFRKLHPDRPILAAILDGDPPDCFPQALRAFGQDGTWHEPLATDLRPKADGKHLGLLKLVAGITGLGLDDLVQRDASRRVRRVMAVTGVAVIAMLIMAALAVVAVKARRDADQARAASEGLVEFMQTDLRERLRGVGRLDIMRDVNRRALAHFDLELARDGDSVEALEGKARTLQAIGEDDLTRMAFATARVLFQQAHRITRSSLADSPNDPERIFAHAQSEYWLGRLDELQGNSARAMAAYQSYHVLADRLSQIAPNNPRFLGEAAYSESNLGSIILNGFNRPAAARPHFEKALRGFLAVGNLEPGKTTWLVEAANARAWIADTWFAEGHYAEAREERLQQELLDHRLAELDPGNQAYRYAGVVTQRSLSRIYQQLGDYRRALDHLEDARASIRALLNIDSENAVWRDQAIAVEINRTQALAALRRMPEARRALESAQQLFGASPNSDDARHVQIGRIIASMRSQY